MSNKALAAALYRAVHRWARDAKAVPFTVKTTDVQDIVPEIQGSLEGLDVEDATGLLQLARLAFRANMNLEVGDDGCRDLLLRLLKSRGFPRDE
jgi:hypothetical protein